MSKTLVGNITGPKGDKGDPGDIGEISDAEVSALLADDGTDTNAAAVELVAGQIPDQDTPIGGALSATIAEQIEDADLSGQIQGALNQKIIVSEDPDTPLTEGQILFVVRSFELADLDWSHLWLASDVAVSDGAQVASWADSVEGTSLAKASANGPTLDADGFGGLPALVFGGAEYMECTLPSALSGDVTILVIGQTSATVNSETFVDSTTSTGRVSLSKSYNGGASQWAVTEDSAGITSAASTHDDNPHVFIAHSPASGNTLLYVDGIDVTFNPAALSRADIATFQVGARYSDTNILNGKIVAVGILNRALTSNERSRIQQYAETTWGV